MKQSDKEAIDRLLNSNKLLITTHRRPDGDGLGCELALYRAFTQMGKEVHLFNADPTPPKFSIVDPDKRIQVYSPDTDLPEYDLAVVVDTNDWKLLGPLEQALRSNAKPTLFIDHHQWDGPSQTPNEYHLIEQVGSTGEMVYELLQTLDCEIDLPTATAIYVAMTSDARTFGYQGTSSRFHTICSALLQKGVSSERVYQHIFARDSLNKIRLFGHVLEKVETAENDQIAWLKISKQDREYYQATIEETESFVNQLTLVKGVRIGMMLRELNEGEVKVSLRGMEGIPVIEIAEKFGGGGHRHAAGMRVKGTVEEAVELILIEAKRLLPGSVGKIYTD